MSHLAIARKWRPQVFEDLVGQQHISRTLQNAIRLGRVHHAFLFTGARGVGKTSAARVLARALNCERGPAPNPCNQCGACLEMLAGSFPDVVEIDAASHNSVDDVRDLVEKSRYTPQRGRSKIYIIDEVHMVTKQGFNALLKTLEEPPAHVIFILATTDPQKLLDTVVSRCQRFDFKMIPVRTIFEHLKHVATEEGVLVPDAALMTIAREGGGSMRDAQSLLDQVLSFSDGAVSEAEVSEILGFIDRSILYETLEATLSGHAGAGLEVLARVRLYGYDTRAFAEQLLEAVRNVLVVRLVDDAGKLMDLADDEVARLRALAKGKDPSLLRQQFDLLASAVDAITRSEQPMLLLEMAVVKIAMARPFVPIEQLMDRLEGLETRLARAGARPSAAGAGAPDRGVSREAPVGRAAPERGEAPPHEASRPREAAARPPPTAAPPSPPRQAPPGHIDAPLRAPATSGSMVNSILNYTRGGDRAPAAAPPAPPEDEPEPSPARTLSVPALSARTPSAPAPSVPAPSASPVAHLMRSEPVAVATRGEPTRVDPAGTDRCDGPTWRRFVHSLSHEDSLVLARGMLSRSGFLSEEGGVIRIGFSTAITLRHVEQEVDEPLFVSALRGWFGDDARLDCRLDEENRSGRSLAEELDRVRADRTDTARREALVHPAILLTQSVFPGARVLGEPRVPEIEEIDDVQ